MKYFGLLIAILLLNCRFATAQTELEASSEFVRVTAGDACEISVRIKDIQRQLFDAKDVLRFAVLEKPAGAMFDSTRGFFSWTPDYTYENSTVTLVFKLYKNDIEIATKKIRVDILKENYAPEAFLPSEVHTQPGKESKIKLDYKDKASRKVNITFLNAGNNPITVRIIADTLYLLPSKQALNGSRINLDLKFDNGIRASTRTLRVLVENSLEQEKPRFYYERQTLVLQENQTRSVDCSAFDANGDPIIYRVANASEIKVQTDINIQGKLTVTAPINISADSIVNEIAVEARDPYNSPAKMFVRVVVRRSVSVLEKQQMIARYRQQFDSLKLLLTFIEDYYIQYNEEVEKRRKIKNGVSIALLPIGAATGFTALLQNLDTRTLVSGILAGFSTIVAGAVTLNNINRLDADATRLAGMSTDIYDYITDQNIKYFAKTNENTLLSKVDEYVEALLIFRNTKIYRLRFMIRNNKLMKNVAKKYTEPNHQWILYSKNVRLPLTMRP